jgi:hypothetical protein
MGHHEDHINKQLQEAEQGKRIYEQTIQALRTEERFVNFFKAYNPTSIEQFMDVLCARGRCNGYRYAGNFEHYAAQKLQHGTANRWLTSWSTSCSRNCSTSNAAGWPERWTWRAWK